MQFVFHRYGGSYLLTSKPLEIYCIGHPHERLFNSDLLNTSTLLNAVDIVRKTAIMKISIILVLLDIVFLSYIITQQQTVANCDGLLPIRKLVSFILRIRSGSSPIPKNYSNNH